LVGDAVAILGLGGLGHLGVQFAARWVSAPWPWRADRTRDLAFELGAHHYIDSTATSVAEELQKLGGARVVPATHGELITLAVIADSLHV
jgi:alcohol dehydrogenase